MEEAPQGERIRIKTVGDCKHRHNHGKTEKLVLASGGRLAMDVKNEGEVPNARRVGARLQDNAQVGEETKERVSALRAKVVVVASAWSWGRQKPDEARQTCVSQCTGTGDARGH